METENSKLRLFVDMDGTLAVFKPVDIMETLYEKDYFRNLEPQENVVEAINLIIDTHPEIEVNILSSVLSDSRYALDEKNAWIDKYLPKIAKEHRIFPPCGENKKDFIQGGVSKTDFLLDDYTANLNEWEPPAKGIKLMNGINGTKGTWQSERLSMERSGNEMAEKIVNVMNGKEHLADIGPKNSTEIFMGDGNVADSQTVDVYHARKGR